MVTHTKERAAKEAAARAAQAKDSWSSTKVCAVLFVCMLIWSMAYGRGWVNEKPPFLRDPNPMSNVDALIASARLQDEQFTQFSESLVTGFAQMQIDAVVRTASEMEQEYGEKVSLTYPSHLTATERKFVMDSARLAITGCDFPMDNSELERFTNSFIFNLQQKNAAFIESLSREETVKLTLEMFVGLPEEAREFMRQQTMNMSDEEFENHRDAGKALDVDAIREFVRGAARPMMGK